MADKIEFAGPEWHERLKGLLEKYTAAAGPDVELTICEVFTDVPEHLDKDGSGRIAWNCRIAGGKVDFRYGEIASADLKTIADYDFVLRLARMKMEEGTLAEYRAIQAEGAASGKLNTTGDHSKIPPSFHGMHNDLAEVTA
ncbi:hypothetical protein [Sphingosinicella microcystinivorans]|uniref:hypothetical protein n=1 Tax=Sphingosinicella microcystinivorans TaxID=335406 RepID=UPI0022F3AFF0|nr:hypothetical protein [Sphingosinicella microcystinivorans]WBX85159.1 hypothetical protein PE061_04315 [Sphingosinicella microcystinivorans]